MKIVIINTAISRGGAARTAFGIYKGLIEKNDSNISPFFVSGYKESKTSTQVSYVYQNTYKYINALYFRISGNPPFLKRKLWQKIIQLEILPADIIHIHNAHGYYLPDFVLREILKKPVVWTLHDSWLFTGRCAVPKSCEGWLEKCEYCPHRDWYPASIRKNYAKYFDRKRELLKNTKITLTVPSNAALIEKNEFQVGNIDIRVVPNGIDTSIFEPFTNNQERQAIFRMLGLFDDGRSIASFISNRVEDPDKNFDLFSEACRGLDKDVRLIVMGNVQKRTKNIYTYQHPGIVFTGYLYSKEQIATYLKISDILVSPSISETFGLSCLEALSCGAIPVVFDHKVFKEILGNFAVFADDTTALSLSVAIKKALSLAKSDNQKKHRHNYVKRNFSTVKMVESYYSLYRQKISINN